MSTFEFLNALRAENNHMEFSEGSWSPRGAADLQMFAAIPSAATVSWGQTYPTGSENPCVQRLPLIQGSLCTLLLAMLMR